MSESAASLPRCDEVLDPGYGRVVQCDRFADHEGQHEAVAFDVAWGPQEPTGKWVGDRWVRHGD